MLGFAGTWPRCPLQAPEEMAAIHQKTLETQKDRQHQNSTGLTPSLQQAWAWNNICETLASGDGARLLRLTKDSKELLRGNQGTIQPGLATPVGGREGTEWKQPCPRRPEQTRAEECDRRRGGRRGPSVTQPHSGGGGRGAPERPRGWRKGDNLALGHTASDSGGTLLHLFQPKVQTLVMKGCRILGQG